MVHEGVRARLKSRRPTDGAEVKHVSSTTETLFRKENGPCRVLCAKRPQPATMVRGAAVSPLAKLRLGLSNNLRVLPSTIRSCSVSATGLWTFRALFIVVQVGLTNSKFQ